MQEENHGQKIVRHTPRRQNLGGQFRGRGFAATKLPENVESLETIKQLFLFVTIFFLSN